MSSSKAKGKKLENAPLFVALTGNPNCGKTTIFNGLTGLRAKIGNYAGVTVERKEGRMRGAAETPAITILDLPGTYSLGPKTLDERISRDALFQRLAEVPAPRAVVVVVDAANLQRNLYYATQVIELGYPTVLALNMMDVAEQNGHQVDALKLSELLETPVVPMVARSGKGLAELKEQILKATAQSQPATNRHFFCQLPAVVQTEVESLARLLAQRTDAPPFSPPAEALLLLSDDTALQDAEMGYPPEVVAAVREARQRLTSAGLDWATVAIESRYQAVAAIHQAAVTEVAEIQETFSDRLDRVVTHKFWGLAIFLGLMALVFQSIFVFASAPMDLISAGIDRLGEWVAHTLPPGAFTDLLVNGIIAGVGAVVMFLPQILLLFLFVSLLEDSGYMARAAFIMDRLMSKVGLHGKSFIPMLSSFACAIPGIMATRTIESPKDRLVTILIAPLMSCSARLPVYTVLIAACLPERRVLGIVQLSGLVMLGAYLTGVLAALGMAWVFKKTLLKATTPLLIMELPPYKRPLVTVILRHMWDRSKLFLTQAGTVILGINILLWFFASYPKNAALEEQYQQAKAAAVRAAFPAVASPEAVEMKLAELARMDKTKLTPAATEALAQVALVETEHQAAVLRQSFAGRLGRLIEPVIEPLGFDWKIGIGILSSFAAREVFVSTMSVVYNVGQAGASDEEKTGLVKVLQQQKRPDGAPLYSTITGLSLIVFYIFALQCASTVAVVKRETNSWKWPLFQWFYLGALAWLMSFLVYQGGRLLGFS